MTRCKLLKYLSAMLFLIPFAAPSYGIDVRPAVKIGADFGGDNLVTVGTTGSSGSGSESLKAGQGIFLGAGASILSDAKDLEFEITLNYKFSSISKGNGDVDWTVMPLDMLVFYRIPHWRFGGGLTYHINPTLKGSGLASGLNADYKDALGLVVQADYMFGEKAKLGLRYTAVNYKASKIQDTSGVNVTSEPPASAKTNAVGLVFTVSF